MVWKSSSQVWAWLHEQAFRYFGGCCQYVVLDNLKEGVIRPDIYEPQLNRFVRGDARPLRGRGRSGPRS
ncbi:MAG: hypothetical protein IPI02_12215 [Sterolibacteriaceae bacterium]|nr:hypothetical protein [Sterolibacteriaceae bacterium]